MSQQQYIDLFLKTGALLEGHFRLTSGLHSAQYFQCAKVLQYPEYATALCENIVDYFKTEHIDCVVSPAVGGIVVGQEVARQLNCKSIFAERENGAMALRRGFEINDGDRVLVVEDVVTTGGSVLEVVDLIKAKGGKIVGIGYIVDRSGDKNPFDVPNHAVFKMDVVTHQPDDCPLCEKGIPAVKPGSRKEAV